MTYFDIGNRCDEQSVDALATQIARDVYLAVVESNFCELIEIRRNEDGHRPSDLIVIDMVCDGVPTKNSVGIQYRERLALQFFDDTKCKPEVRSLRKDFPLTYHQNQVPKGQPPSLCIYLEPWSSVRRAWTPQKFLKRTAKWLENTADGTLHGDDQPLEPLFFDNALSRLVLPSDFDEKIGSSDWRLVITNIVQYDDAPHTMTGQFVQSNQAGRSGGLSLHVIAIETAPVEHGIIEQAPLVLSDLHAIFSERGVDLEPLIYAELDRMSDQEGLRDSVNDMTLLVISVPLQRNTAGKVESRQVKGFGITEQITQFGRRCGILRSNDEEGDPKYYFAQNLESPGRYASDDWKGINIEPVDILFTFTQKDARRYSGIEDETFQGALAGVGALGSAVHNIWIREGWGSWNLIDPDLLNPHNLARHTALAQHIGAKKIDALSGLESAILPHDEKSALVHYGDVDPDLPLIKQAELIVDMTTSLQPPRDIAQTDGIARTVSAFITPSGLSSVMLLEDKAREIRLDALEAQYYTAILQNEWGESHLIGHKGSVWVGAGCRDKSLVIATDLIQLHASILARQIRLKSASDQAKALCWHVDQDTGVVDLYEMDVTSVQTVERGDYTIVWNDHIVDKVRSIRNEKLPCETGGIILGYIDKVLSRVYVVDVCTAPANSKEELTGFERGVEGVLESVNQAQERTGNIVSYIGEWHSHPKGSSTDASILDITLMKDLTMKLHEDGLPAFMLIVGDDDENWMQAEVV